MSILITGAAGFIGYHLSKKLIKDGFEVIGFDNLNSYYDKKLKQDRIHNLNKIANEEDGIFEFEQGDLVNSNQLKDIFKFKKNSFSKIKIVIHLAAQAGVRYSIENPKAYIESNLVGFYNLIEECKINKIDHLIYASSSSVYGGNRKLPFLETDNVDHPISLYAATKKSNELIAHSYSHLFNLPTTGLRFFTVYGPWGRPDMALFKFTDLIVKNKPISVFNYGKMKRDFTYIDDVIESISLLMKKPPGISSNINSTNTKAPYFIFNIGNSQPIDLMQYINAIESILGKKAKIKFKEMQPGDVESTFANTEALNNWINFKPSTPINLGVKKFIDWYLEYYK